MVAKKSKPSGTLLIRDIDPKLKKRFKLWCVRHDVSQAEQIKRMMEQLLIKE